MTTKHYTELKCTCSAYFHVDRELNTASTEGPKGGKSCTITEKFPAAHKEFNAHMDETHETHGDKFWNNGKQ